jgi:hypothetical protein
MFSSLKVKINDEDWKKLVKMTNDVADSLAEAGHDPRALFAQLKGDAQTMSAAAEQLDEVLAKALAQDAKAIARRSIPAFRDEGKRIQHREAMLKHAEETKDKKRFGKTKSFVGRKVEYMYHLMYSKAEGNLALNKMKASVEKFWVAQTLERQLHQVMGGDHLKPLKDPQFRSDVVDEFFALQHGKETVTKNAQARAYASILYDVRNQQRVTLNVLGGGYSHRSNSIPITFDVKKITANSAQFIRDLANGLAERTHGDIGRRTELAKAMYDTLVKNDGITDFRRFGDFQPVGEAEKLPIAVVEYADGANWRNLNDNYGTTDFMGTIVNEVSHLAAKEAEIRLVGSEKVFEDLLKEAQLDEHGNHDGHYENTVRIARDRYQRLTRTFIPEYIRLARLLSAGRSLEVMSKLGSATLAAFTDVPIYIHAFKQFAGVGPFKALSSASRAWSREGMQHARYMLAGSEGGSAYFSNRFSFANDPLGKSADYLARASNFVLALSGLNGWTNGWKSMVVATMDRHIGDMIAKGTKWGELDPKFRDGMARFGISEKDWERIAHPANLDKGRGYNLFNMFGIPESAEERFGSNFTLQQKLTAYYTHFADNAILSPDEVDTQMLTFGIHPTSPMADVMKTLTQFLSFPITAHRRVLARTLTDKNISTKSAVTGLAALYAANTVINWIGNQSREVLKGNNLISPADPSLWAKSAASTPFGMLVDYSIKMAGGQKFLDELASTDSTQGATAVDLLGATVKDIYKIAEQSAGATAAAIKGNDRKRDKYLGGLAKQLLGLVPGENLWWGQLLYRREVFDTIMEAVDPTGYRHSVNNNLRSQEQRLDLLTLQPTSQKQNALGVALGGY